MESNSRILDSSKKKLNCVVNNGMKSTHTVSPSHCANLGFCKIGGVCCLYSGSNVIFHMLEGTSGISGVS